MRSVFEGAGGFSTDEERRRENLVKWISVEEALPEYGVPVIGAIYTTDLIIAKDGETIEEAVARCTREAARHPRVELCYLEEDGWNGFDGFPMVCSPSYWMSLPEAPVLEE